VSGGLSASSPRNTAATRQLHAADASSSARDAPPVGTDALSGGVARAPNAVRAAALNVRIFCALYLRQACPISDISLGWALEGYSMIGSRLQAVVPSSTSMPCRLLHAAIASAICRQDFMNEPINAGIPSAVVGVRATLSVS